MAIPLSVEQINNLVVTTLEAYRPEIIDNFFLSNALMVRLRTKNKVLWKGGREIQFRFIYDKLGGGSYGQGDPFDITLREFMTYARLPWKRNYVPMTMDGLEDAENSGAHEIIDYTATLKEVAKMTLDDNTGHQIYGDGTGNEQKDLDGFKIAVNDTGTYGGITRGSEGPGKAISSFINRAGGPFSFSMVNSALGKATIGRQRPDLITTTQEIWDKAADRSQASERNRAEDLREVGMESIRIYGADMVVDQHCPDGEMHLHNTNFIEYWVMNGNDFRLRGPFDLHNMDAWTAQYVVYSNLVVKSPRLQTRVENVF